MNEAEARVQGDRGRHVVADHRHHLPEAAALAFLDQAREERPADAAAMRGGVDIDRVLDGVAVGRARPIGARIGVASTLAPSAATRCG
jgi:hypothetical protein